MWTVENSQPHKQKKKFYVNIAMIYSENEYSEHGIVKKDIKEFILALLFYLKLRVMTTVHKYLLHVENWLNYTFLY